MFTSCSFCLTLEQSGNITLVQTGADPMLIAIFSLALAAFATAVIAKELARAG